MSERRKSQMLPDEYFQMKEIGDYLWFCSKFVYAFWYLRDIVRSYDKDVGFRDQETNNLEDCPSNKIPSSEKVEFDTPSLIITDKGDPNLKTDSHRHLNYSISPAAISKFIKLNRKYLKEQRGGDYLFFNKDHERFGKKKGLFGRVEDVDEPLDIEKALDLMKDVNQEIVDYNDKAVTKNGGLAHCLILNHTQKIVVLAFRGSQGSDDLSIDIDYTLTDKGGYGDGAKTHKGFTGYLFEGEDEDHHQIHFIIESINDALEKHPDYKLYITGHSLGGALASMCAFHLANLKKEENDSVGKILKRITAITWAAPVVGNAEYAAKYEWLEQNGFLYHIRITNQGDVVPTNAQLFGVEKFVLKGDDPSLYKQNGVNLHMYSNNHFLFSGKETDLFRASEPMTLASQLYSGGKRLILVAAPNAIFGTKAGSLTHLMPEYYTRWTHEENNGKMRELSVDGVYKEAHRLYPPISRTSIYR